VAPAPTGDDGNPGTQSQPWATFKHAAAAVPGGCTVWFEDGVYTANSDVDRQFRTQTVFRAVHPYRAIFQGNGYVLNLGGSSHMTFRGLQIKHSGPGATGIVVYVGGTHTNHIVFRDDILHDSYGDDVLKILDGAHQITVADSLFYNQGNGEQLIDVNSVANVTIEDSVFMNDFAAGGRSDTKTTKHYIVVKDSNGNTDGIRGSTRVSIKRNVLLNWEGGQEELIAVGNDGKRYFEAKHVSVVNNLVIGNGTDPVYAAFQVQGAIDVAFVNNTVVGNLPSSGYAFHVDTVGANPRNRQISFWNNIWSDPTGTMHQFSVGNPKHTVGLVLDHNLYWNGGKRVPHGEVASPTDDRHRVVRNPRLNPHQGTIELPYWLGSAFPSGKTTIRAEFVRLVRTYGLIPRRSPAVGRALASKAPARDILGRKRTRRPDIGAYEAR
jgi:hypothetical protein